VVDASRRLRTTFDSVADRYQEARPAYPVALFDTLQRATGISAGDQLLEIGCGTGIATLPLAERGFHLTCIELGPELAAAARRNLAGFPEVNVVTAAFEDWRPADRQRFDLVFAATAWHWVDPTVGYPRVWELLRPGGHFAFWSAVHVIREDGDPFFAELQQVYDEIGEGMPAEWQPPRPGQLPDDREEVEGSGLFELVGAHQFDWEVSYTAEDYLRLLDTFSNHIALEAGQRDHLYGEIRRRLARRPDGRVRRHWGSVLQVARRLDHPAAARP
jgi:SAM-dependent methyltransferase